MINGHTKLVGLIGHPVEHSLSPVIHNAAFNALNMNWCYVPLDIEEQDLVTAINGLKAAGFYGLNITAPHKQTAIPIVVNLDIEASSVGAVNTLIFRKANGESCDTQGFNTDVYGFTQSLKSAGFSFNQNDKVVVVGAGGAAKAVIMGLINEKVKNIIVLNRNTTRAKNICQEMKQLMPSSRNISAEPLNNETIIRFAADASLLVNATTVGTSPNIDLSIWPDDKLLPKQLFVFDLVYNPAKTKLLKQAEKSCIRGINGLEMLVQQAARSFELWTDIKPPIDEMHKACNTHDGGKNA